MEEVYPKRMAKDRPDLSRCAAVPDRACDLGTSEANCAQQDEVGLSHLHMAVKEECHLECRGRNRSSCAAQEVARVAPSAVKTSFALCLESSGESVKSSSEIEHLEERHQRCFGKPHLAENWAGGRS